MNIRLTRRQLLTSTAVGALAAKLGLDSIAWADDKIAGLKPGMLPQRVLGKTGVSVPIIGFGTAPAGNLLEQDVAVALYNEAIDLGVTYMDTAPSHTGYGNAQEHLGHVLKERRREVFLTTKCFEAKGDAALKLLEKNLKQLQTEQADLVYVHSVGANEMDFDTVIGKDGVLQALLKAKRDGLTRFVGISGHSRPGRFVRILNDFDIDVMMNAVNFVDRHIYDFEQQVWPIAKHKNVGLVAMKVFGGPEGKAMSSKMPVQYIPQAVRYALSLPGAAAAVLGMSSREELHQNVGLARDYKPLTAEEQAGLDKIGTEMAKEWGARFGPIA